MSNKYDGAPRKNKVLRKVVGQSLIDSALRDIYDRIDDLQDPIAITGSPMIKRDLAVGSKMLVNNYKGDDAIAIKTQTGWKVDINSKLSPIMNGFRPSMGLKSTHLKPIEDEALLYNKYGNINIVNIPEATSDTDKFLISDKGTVKYITGDTLKTYINGLRFDGSTANGILTYKDDDEISVQEGISTSNGKLIISEGATLPGYSDGTLFKLGSGLLTDDATFQMYAYDDADDSFRITTGQYGATAMVTFNNNGTNTAHMSFQPQGDFQVNVTDGVFKIYKPNIGKYFQIGVEAGVSLLTTNDAEPGTTAAHMQLQPDGDLILDPATNTINILASVGEITTLSVADTSGIFTIATTASTATDADIVLDAGGGIHLDADNGEARLTDGGSTFTPANAADIATKAYVDAGDVLKVATVAITEAEFNALHTTEKVLVAAQGSGKAIIPIKVVCFANRDASIAQGTNASMWISIDGATTASPWGYYKRFMKAETGDRILTWFTSVGENCQSLPGADNKPITAKFDMAITAGSMNDTNIQIIYTVVDVP